MLDLRTACLNPVAHRQIFAVTAENASHPQLIPAFLALTGQAAHVTH
jgi:hypothetical protein